MNLNFFTVCASWSLVWAAYFIVRLTWGTASRCSSQIVTQGMMSRALMAEEVSTATPGWSLDRAALIQCKGSTLVEVTWPPKLPNKALLNNRELPYSERRKIKANFAEEMAIILATTSGRTTMWMILAEVIEGSELLLPFCILCAISA